MSIPVRYISLLVIISGIFFGCAKSVSDVNTFRSSVTATAPAYFTTDPRLSPYYGDSILYLQGNDPFGSHVKPLNSLGAGTYVAWPAGITIDPQTGAIDLLHSEPGSRYNIGFVSAATHDTVYSQIILAGASYVDGVYALDAGDSLLQPYYNAQQGMAVPASASNQWNAYDQQVSVSFTNGSINLKQSLQNGLFGNHPQNGDTKVITIYYRLNDNSGWRLQSTSLVLHYYNTLADVPADLLNTVRQASTNPVESETTSSSVGSISTDASSPTPKIVIVSVPPKPTPARPPQVVIVNVGH
jgi:hypothetical protein